MDKIIGWNTILRTTPLWDFIVNVTDKEVKEKEKAEEEKKKEEEEKEKNVKDDDWLPENAYISTKSSNSVKCITLNCAKLALIFQHTTKIGYGNLVRWADGSYPKWRSLLNS